MQLQFASDKNMTTPFNLWYKMVRWSRLWCSDLLMNCFHLLLEYRTTKPPPTWWRAWVLITIAIYCQILCSTTFNCVNYRTDNQWICKTTEAKMYFPSLFFIVIVILKAMGCFSAEMVLYFRDHYRENLSKIIVVQTILQKPLCYIVKRLNLCPWSLWTFYHVLFIE